jgi:hypothetical protein
MLARPDRPFPNGTGVRNGTASFFAFVMLVSSNECRLVEGIVEQTISLELLV